MSRHTGARAKINRRLGTVIFENSGTLRAVERRPQPAFRGRGKKSTYGLAMQEKQKIKYYYGLGERQLRNLFTKARHMHGNAGELLLILCERRFDNAVRRAGFTTTRAQARQGIAHGHFLLNGQKVDIPSCLVRPGDVISIKQRDNLNTLYRSLVAEQTSELADWVVLDESTLVASVLRLPTPEDISLPCDVNMVVELLSR